MSGLVDAVEQLFGLDGHRFEGYSDGELADAIEALRAGPGAAAMQPASQALQRVSRGMYEIDTTLHEQLAAIGIDWQTPESSDLAKAMLTRSKQYAATSGEHAGSTAGKLDEQGAAVMRARNAMPDPSTLRASCETGPAAGAGGQHLLTGHGQHDASLAAARKREARDRAVDAWRGYAGVSHATLGGYRALPPPPVAPAAGGVALTSTVAASAAAPEVAAPPAAAAGNPAVPGAGSAPGSASPGTPVPGGGRTGAAVPDGPPAATQGGHAGAAPGSPPAPGTGSGHPANPGTRGPLEAGRMTGVGPVLAEPAGGSAARAAGSVARGFSAAVVNDAAMGAAIASGAGGAGAAGRAAAPERLVTGRGAPRGVVEDARGNRIRPFEEPEERAAAARVASRVAGGRGQPEEGPSMLEPATTRGEQDGRRVRRYGVESEDLFADDTMVSQPVLGED